MCAHPRGQDMGGAAQPLSHPSPSPSQVPGQPQDSLAHSAAKHVVAKGKGSQGDANPVPGFLLGLVLALSPTSI